MGLFIFTAVVFADTTTPSATNLGVENVGTLPTSRLYFLKEWGRGLKLFFTFDPVKKADLQADIANEKAAEAQKVEEDSPQNADAIKNAIENYKSSSESLKARLESLKANSQNPNIDKLLSKLADRAVKHEKLFSELEKKFEGNSDLKKITDNVKNTLEDTAAVAAGKDDPAAFAARLQKALSDAEGGDLKSLGSLDILKRLSDKVSDDIKKSLDSLKENLGKEASKDVEDLLKKTDAKTLQDTINNLPGDAASKAKIIEEIKKHADKNSFKPLEDIGKFLDKELKDESDNENENDNKNANKTDNKSESEKGDDGRFIQQNSATVVIDESGNFNPQEVKIKKGGKVTWVNKSQNPVQPASNPHPIHTDYPGFDALRGLANGESYSFTFDKVGSWGYHNHLNPSIRGEVKVVE